MALVKFSGTVIILVTGRGGYRAKALSSVRSGKVGLERVVSESGEKASPRHKIMYML